MKNWAKTDHCALLKKTSFWNVAVPRLTAKDFPQELLDDYDDYAHGKITKREFLNLAAKYAGGGMTALALFNVLKPNYALATQVEFTDPDIPALIMVFIMTRHRVMIRLLLI